MDRKAIARQTIEIMKNGYYMVPVEDEETKRAEQESKNEKRIEIRAAMEKSISGSTLVTPEEGVHLLKKYDAAIGAGGISAADFAAVAAPALVQTVENMSTVDAIRKLAEEGRQHIGVLNFASAKNPGGGFLNGAMAQEESLAASSTLYRTLIAHEEYYRANRAQNSMMYTDYGIYSPQVTFFRYGNFRLAEHPVSASVLTLPAVNMGQAVRKGEDIDQAERVMKRRMKLALAIFAEQGDRNLVLGAYGCGVFRNDPKKVAVWWKEILEEGMAGYFDTIFYAVLDRSEKGSCIQAFMETF